MDIITEWIRMENPEDRIPKLRKASEKINISLEVLGNVVIR